MNRCLDVARIGKRVPRDRQRLGEGSTHAIDHHIPISFLGCPAGVDGRETFTRSVAESEVREVAAVSQQGRERARESGLTCTWRTKQLDDHAPLLPTAPTSGARFRA